MCTLIVFFVLLEYFCVPSVLWYCWSCKTVSHITYTVSVETLNPAQSISAKYCYNWVNIWVAFLQSVKQLCQEQIMLLPVSHVKFQCYCSCQTRECLNNHLPASPRLTQLIIWQTAPEHLREIRMCFVKPGQRRQTVAVTSVVEQFQSNQSSWAHLGNGVVKHQSGPCEH